MFDRKVDILGRLVATTPFMFDYRAPGAEISFNRKVSTLFLSEQRLFKPGESVIVAADTIAPTPEEALNYFQLLDTIKVCSDNAEHVKELFLSANIRISHPDGQNREALIKLDFMSLKDRLFDQLKRDSAFLQRAYFSSNQKFKKFRKDVNQFVLDRNVLTHGQLHLLKPGFTPVIEYISSGLPQKQYSYIQIDELKEFNNVYSEIVQFFQSIVFNLK